jgi:hypothetical protein
MKQLFIILIGLFSVVGFISCNTEDTWDTYADWREANLAWWNAQEALTNEDGTPYYEKLYPDWDTQSYVLIKFFNDRSKTAGNLSPIYTSTVNVKYRGRLYDDEVFDSSYSMTTYGDSIYQTTLGDVISGWNIALSYMHVGDSCEVIVPYTQGYGTTGSGSILPYSMLKFDIKLVDIPYYELPNLTE